MSYDVVIRRASDGVERTYRMDNCPCPEDADDFWWTEGNGACDCNRGDFFARAGGEEDPDTPCGDSAYFVMKFIRADGTEIEGPDAKVGYGAKELR
jgi:hypothetical protein